MIRHLTRNPRSDRACRIHGGACFGDQVRLEDASRSLRRAILLILSCANVLFKKLGNGYGGFGFSDDCSSGGVPPGMVKSMATLDSGTTCSSWNYSGHQLAAGSIDGILSVYDSHVPSASSSSSFTYTSKVRASEASVAKIIWLPSEYGDAVACIG